MPFTQKLKSGPVVWQKLHISFCHSCIHHFKIWHKDSASLPNLVFSFSFCIGSSLKPKPRTMLAPNHCTVFFSSSWVLENDENLSQQGSESNHLFPGVMASKKHFWTGTVVTKPAHISGQSSQSCWQENLTPLRSLRAHSFSPSLLTVHNGRNILSLKWHLNFFLPLGLVCNTIPIYPEESSLSILYHVPYCCTWSRGNWSFLMQQSPDNSNTASVKHAGATAGHAHSSTHRGLAYFTTKTQASEERPSQV